MIVLALLAAAPSAVDCANTPVQSEMNECALVEYNKVDDALNVQWKRTSKVFAGRSAGDVARLRAAQRAWIAFRDADCDAEYPWDIGVSLDKMSNIYCRTEMTAERTHRLEELAKDQ